MTSNMKLKVNRENMSLSERVSWVVNEIPHLLGKFNGDINISISDVEYIVKNEGSIYICKNEYHGKGAALKAIETAIDMLGKNSILLENASAVLVCFEHPYEYPILEVGNAFEVLLSRVPYEGIGIFGTSTSSEKHVRITIVLVIDSYDEIKRN